MRKKIVVEDLNPSIIKTPYGVRTKLDMVVLEAMEGLEGDEVKKYPFEEIIFCDSEDPSQFFQPMSFARNVLSLCTSPNLLNHPSNSQIFKKDEIKRAESIVRSAPGIYGGYSHDQGFKFVREEVKEFIKKRDGVNGPESDRIWLVSGSGRGLEFVLQTFISEKKDCVLIPFPQCPNNRYTTQTVLFGGSYQPYYLNENDNWSVSSEELNRSFQSATLNNNNLKTEVKICIAINPGNPTGNIFDSKSMENLISFCVENRIVLIADECYQDNVYVPKKWKSFRKVMFEMGFEKDLYLVSIHSCSRGVLGESGRRGGYVEFSDAFDNEYLTQMYKMASLSLPSNITGQILTSVMVNPPKLGSSESFTVWKREKEGNLEAMDRKMSFASKFFLDLPSISLGSSEGGIFIFPRIRIPQKAVEEWDSSKKKYVVEMKPDEFYCINLFEETGIVTVPGGSFRVDNVENDNQFIHIRMSILPQEDVFYKAFERFKKFHSEFIRKYE